MGTFIPYDFDISRYVSLENPAEYDILGNPLTPGYLGDMPHALRIFVGNVFQAASEFQGKTYGDLAPAFRKIAERKERLLQIIDASPVDDSHKAHWRSGIETIEAFTRFNLDGVPHFIEDTVEISDSTGAVKCYLSPALRVPIITQEKGGDKLMKVTFGAPELVNRLCKKNGWVLHMKSNYHLRLWRNQSPQAAPQHFWLNILTWFLINLSCLFIV